ncbi:linoleoyl-CoA desaturase [Chitinophaga sp. YR573]|uniref:fatty acid desaturase family protein n=1 Tax=Chitinophaga sp. YR573 TaxID=1881040 RepID=UPI0008C509F6|nr:acyl-CoA desaturase [Chitinophaga sp. YR573]SEW20704.1 linoleoyl-CoA desaturase [Chitinophaga sp. YR573]
MKSKKLEIVRFAPKGKDSFMEAVKTAVNEYFESNRISTYANTEMWVKTAVMLALYFVPCTLMITGVAAGHPWLFFGFWFVMGIGMTGIGTSVMHDANHGAYSSNKKVNNFIGHVLELIGGYVANWKIQHNILHHTYTNIHGLDEDIHSIKLLRFSPNQPRYWYHRYQHIYAWFFYMIMTLFWMTAKDYIQVFRYKQHDLLVKQKVTLKTAMLRISIAKVFYYSYILVLPLLFSGMPWYAVLAGFLGMHFVAGLFLSCIFQPAHVIGESAFNLPVEGGDHKRMEDSWAVHEVANTSNYAPRSRVLSWFIGGLNYQIEHHLFSNICHVHYRKLAPIVKSITASFKIPYNVQSNFLLALWAHGKMLKQLGREG